MHQTPISFQTGPSQYRHWRLEIDGEIAQLYMDVDEQGGLFPGYELKLNSYDLGVDIELADITQRLRFEHPEVKVVILRSGKERVFCAGANIRMLAGAAHEHKVNFCKFTNETRNSYEAAGRDSGQHYICAIKGSCAGGGYELALACDHIILADDANSSVALPEAPLLAVLPGTGGLTRLVDKRKVRRDLADVFCTIEEGVKGKRAKDWRLVDELVANSTFEEQVSERAEAIAAKSRKSGNEKGIDLGQLQKQVADDGSLSYSLLEVSPDREARKVTLSIRGPDEEAPSSMEDYHSLGDQAYLVRLARELDDALLHLRFNEPELGLWLFKSQGSPKHLLSHEALLLKNREHWLANEILLYWQRLLKRVDVTSRSLAALVEHGSCFAGILAELVFASDRAYMMNGEFEDDDRPLARLKLSEANFGPLAMANGITRLESRFYGEPESLDRARAHQGEALTADKALELGLVTYAFDDIDWEDELRIFMEERTSFSPDAMTGMEANLRFVGPETLESRIFGRLSAWQNWIFQRPNAVGECGALRQYGTGKRADYDPRRV